MSNYSRAWVSAASVALLTGLAAGAASAQEGVPSAYLGVGGGLIMLQDQNFSAGSKTDADSGWAALGSLGYRWGNGLRTEVEGTYRHNKAKFDTSVPTFTPGTIKATSIMANALVDIDLHGPAGLVPYLGGGVGVARPRYEFGPTSVRDTNFAFQGIAGVSKKINESLEAFVDYHYFSTSGQEVAIGPFTSDNEYHAHEVFAGLRWTFWSGAKPAPTPVAAAPAPVQATPKDYTIYFEFDKANITDAAGAVLDEIKSNTTPSQAVSVRGHADRSGSDAYNMKLSDRRANNTASGLTSRGVKVDSVTGAGEAEPAVPTPDGVKEPLNRRSVIKIEGAGM